MPPKKKAETRVISEADLPPDVPVLKAKDGDVLTVTVDVENVIIPYTVVFDGARTIMHSLVDRREEIALTPGTHRLTWAFTHVQKKWKHEIAAQVSGGPLTVLDSKSESKKDSPYVIGLALIVVT